MKFNDADLIGIPVRVVVGKQAVDGIVEVKNRRTGDAVEVHIDNLQETIQSIYASFES